MRVIWNAAAAGALVLLAPSALAGQLTIVSVTPEGVACVFAPTCMVNASDTYGVFKLFGNGGVSRVLTRTYPGLPGTKAAGMTGYSLRLDLTASTALGMANCIERLIVDVGPLASLPYAGKGNAEVFAVSGDSGAPLSSATQSGGKITFTFAKPICPAIGARPGQASLYFGFAAKSPPVPGKAQIVGTLEGTTTDVRVPKH